MHLSLSGKISIHCIAVGGALFAIDRSDFVAGVRP